MQDHYKVLGVAPTAEDAVIRAAYRALAQKYHPDRWLEDPAQANARMAEINAAYNVLSNPALRKEYDLSRKTDSSTKQHHNDTSASASKETPNSGMRGFGCASPLSGWNRLFIVLSGFMLVAAVWISVRNIPSEEAIQNRRLIESLDLVEKYLLSKEPLRLRQGGQYIRETYYSDLSDEQMLRGLSEKYGDVVDFSGIEIKYKNQLSELPYQWVKSISFGLLLWLLAVTTLYAFGRAIAWIQQGFRNADSE